MLKLSLKSLLLFVLLIHQCRADEDIISHHLSDSYSGPIILLTKRGFDVFAPSRFFNEEGEKVDYKGYYLNEHGRVESRYGESFIDLSLTKNILWMLLSVFILILLFLFCGSWYRRHSFTKAPHGIVNALEMIVLMLLDDIKMNIGEKYKIFSPFLLTLFFFIWINNMLGLLPGAGNVTGSISVTACLALMTFLVVNINGSKHYFKDIFAPKIPVLLYPIIVPIEIIGVFTKPFTLMLRLFASMTSGHIIIFGIISIGFLFNSLLADSFVVILTAVMLVLEFMVSFLQAYIFFLFSAVYIGAAVKEKE